MRLTYKISLLALMAVVAVSCFKDEKYQTLMRIAVYSQNVSTDDATKATDITAYAFFTDKNDDWLVASWEDALARRITHKEDSSKIKEGPDVEGTFDAAAEYQVELPLTKPNATLVMVDTRNKVFAYREYEVGINLPTVYTQLHLYAWRKSGTANGWTVVNPFPDEERESLIETDDTDNSDNSDNTDNTDNTDSSDESTTTE